MEGEGRIRGERACFRSQHLTYTSATVTWKDLICLLLSSYLSFSIAPLIRDEHFFEKGSCGGENERTLKQESVNGYVQHKSIFSTLYTSDIMHESVYFSAL